MDRGPPARARRRAGPGGADAAGVPLLPDETFYASCTESIVSLQGATARIVRHLGLRCDRVVVTFVSNLPAAAHIEYDAGSWYVEIDSRWRGDARSLGAILAHEVCHILVRERGLPRFGTAIDEVHVDLAVMLSGLGALTLNGNRETSERSSAAASKSLARPFGPSERLRGGRFAPGR